MYKIIRANIRFIGGLISMIEEIETYYDEDLEEYIATTYINGRYVKQIYGSPFEQMLIDKINEIIKKLKNSK
jgi:hypothetical protein